MAKKNPKEKFARYLAICDDFVVAKGSNFEIFREDLNAYLDGNYDFEDEDELDYIFVIDTLTGNEYSVTGRVVKEVILTKIE